MKDASTLAGGKGFRDATVSVVVPLYNKELYVKRAVSSILNQTFPAHEIIVVDDGSTDDGPAKALDFGNPKVKLVRQENRGPGAARNAGLSRASGRYVAFLDADDEWLPPFLETGLSWLEDPAKDIAAVFADFVRFPEGENNAGILEGMDDVFEVVPGTSVEAVRKIMIFTCVCTAIIRTEVARKWGGFFDRYRCLRGEDKHLFYKIVFNERIGVIRQPMGFYHTEASSLYGGGKMLAFEMEPHMADDSDLMDACPESKRNVMGGLLADMTVAAVRTLALRGQAKEAKTLLRRLLRNNRGPGPVEKMKLLLLVEASRAFPCVRPAWHAAKRVWNRQRTDPSGNLAARHLRSS